MADTPAASPKVEKDTLPKMLRLDQDIYLHDMNGLFFFVNEILHTP